MQAVHELYSAGGNAVDPVGKEFPGCIENGGTKGCKQHVQFAQANTKWLMQ